MIQNVRTQYVIRNLENHSVELDILAEREDGNVIVIEIQMYAETAPFKRTRIKERYYRTETFPRIVERVKHFKIHKEGVGIMCEIADRIRNKGRIEGMMRAILALLEALGQMPQWIEEIIRTENNISVLSGWLKSVARAGSIAEFEANM